MIKLMMIHTIIVIWVRGVLGMGWGLGEEE